jgi:hypothetical protein
MDKKVYLGDSVYADYDGEYIILTTENGLGPSNIIYIDPQVFQALMAYVEKLKSP